MIEASYNCADGVGTFSNWSSLDNGSNVCNCADSVRTICG
jgi:hypothetical protein